MNSILKFDLTRTKTKTTQEPVVYAHRNKFLWDLYFAFGMHFAIESNPQAMLFPDFFKQVSTSNSKKKKTSIDSKSSTLWLRYEKEITNIAKNYEGRFQIYSTVIIENLFKILLTIVNFFRLNIILVKD